MHVLLETVRDVRALPAVPGEACGPGAGVAPGAVFGSGVAAAVGADTRTEGFVMLHRSYDDWKADDSHIDQGGASIPAKARFPFTCEALVLAVKKAATPDNRPWMAHEAEREALWFTYFVVREARRLGLIPNGISAEAA